MKRVEQVSRAIEDDIRSCKWLPNNKMPGQLALMKRFDVSRTCLREAITGLEAKGLITSRHGSGCYVNNLFEAQFSAPLSGVRLDSLDLQLSVMEMRMVLDGEAAFYVCERASDEELAAIDQVYQATVRGRTGVLQNAKVDLKFHMLIADSSHNLIVTSLSQLLYAKFFSAIYVTLISLREQEASVLDDVWEMIDAQHRAVHKAIMVRDKQAAKAAAKDHIRYSIALLSARR